MASIRWMALLSLLLWSCGQMACQKADEDRADKSGKKSDFPRRSDTETRDQDGLTYLKGEDSPFTGVLISRDKNWQMKYFANYENGQLHGSEIWWHEGGGMKKMLDFERGEKIRHREWFENGNRKIDAMMKDGIAYGRHLRWFEDGSLRFSGNFVEDLKWDGPVKDIHEDGTVMWDAVFKRGHYVSGKYPPSEKQKLIDSGMLKEKVRSQKSEVRRKK